MDEKFRKKKLEEERALLFERKHKSPTSVSDNGNFIQLHKESSSLGRSLSIANDIEDTGISILKNISSQNERIKSIQKRVYDIGLSLGLSRSILRHIERRQFVDSIILYGGMVFILMFMFLLYYYLM